MQADPFIIMNPSSRLKPDADSRRFIRSHVMRGKNRKVQRRPPPGSWINADHDLELQQRLVASAQASDGGDTQQLARAPATAAQASFFGCPLPRHLGDELSFASFAVEMDSSMREAVHNYFAVMKVQAHPVESCLDYGTTEWPIFEYLASDKAFVHSLLFVSYAYFDMRRRQPPGASAAAEMGKTMVALQSNIGSRGLATADTTIFAVLALLMCADIFEDSTAAEKHLAGLRQMLSLRGGLQSLRDNVTLQIKCCRVDVSAALTYGFQPLFSAEDISWKRYLVDDEPAETPLNAASSEPDERLVNVWLDFREFTQAVNLAFQTGHRIGVRMFQEIVISVHYRLLHLAYDPNDQLEAVRLAMLALATSIFLKIHDIPGNYRHLAQQVRRSLQSVELSGTAPWTKLVLWIFFVARLSVLPGAEDESWLHERVLQLTHALSLHSWLEVREVLKSHLWLDIVHDKEGKKFFEDGPRVSERT
ncbi:hypothetical protein GQ53DRAFT_686240 [Thozetella sp. PMI_491]|nr:hypothetical protein GQ53DRAFT_686240 [Thozetella sp. PMI_491]